MARRSSPPSGEPRVVTLAAALHGLLALHQRLAIYTVQLADGNLFYALTVVPERDEAAYAATFESILRSIRLNDRRSS